MFEPVALSGTCTFPMAEDDMEISSEHGHNVGDEDIDIDIDLTAGHVDEDYVLEDATSVVDFGADFQQPAIGQDDLMLDDDNHSYQMDDADLSQHEEAQAVEPESMSFATSAAVVSPEHHGGISNLMPNDMHEDTVVENEQLNISEYTELQGGPHTVDDQETVQLQDLYTIQSQETVEKGDEQYIRATEISADTAPKSASVSPSPEEHHIATPTRDQDGKASPHSAHDSVEAPAHTAEHTEENLENLSFAENDPGSIPAVSEQEELSSTVPDIFVTYRSIQYTLFSLSELEDPDTYFLSDLSIMEKPLPDLFQAIREVIHEDLTDEDELRLSVGGLGLEAQEASPSVEEVTLSQMLNLHETLLRNVEEGSPEPLHLTLDVKPNFQRRFSKLEAGAAEGKGLAEIFPWECMDSAVDSGEEDEHQQELESGERGEEGESKNEAQNSEDKTAHQSPSLLDAGNFQESVPWMPGDSLLNDISAPATTGSEIFKSEKILDSSVDEDGDLIDYSEDELEIEKEQKQAGVPKTANDKIDNEYEQINEDLRRRSLSRDEQEMSEQAKDAQEVSSVEENTLDEWQQISHDSVDPKDEKQHRSEDSITGDEGQIEETPDKWQQSPGTLDELAVNDEDEQEQVEEEGGDGYEDYAKNNPDQSVNAEYEEFDVADSGLDGNHDYSTELGQEFADDSVNYEYGAGEEDYADQNGQDGSFVGGVTGEDVNELNISLETEEQAGLPDSADVPDQNGQVDFSEHIHNSASGSLALLDTAESSVTLSADEIQYEDGLNEKVFDESTKADDTRLWTKDAKPDLNIEQKDEIDYEDDEEEEKSESVSIPLAQPSQGVAEGSPANGKRSRAEVDFEDTWNDNGNITKRRRS